MHVGRHPRPSEEYSTIQALRGLRHNESYL